MIREDLKRFNTQLIQRKINPKKSRTDFNIKTLSNQHSKIDVLKVNFIFGIFTY